MQTKETIAQDFERAKRAPIYRDKRGVEYFRKPRRRKKLTAAQAAVIFDAQTQIHNAEKLIARLLLQAGYHSKESQARIRNCNWLDRGRIDVIHPASAPDSAPRSPGWRRSDRRKVA